MDDYRSRIWGAVADYHGAKKPLVSFCDKCGAYLRPEANERVCDDCQKQDETLPLFNQTGNADILDR